MISGADDDESKKNEFVAANTYSKSAIVADELEGVSYWFNAVGRANNLDSKEESLRLNMLESATLNAEQEMR